MIPISFDVVTLTLNPAVDIAVEIDNFSPGTVNRVSSHRSIAGGKGVNVAAALVDDGWTVAATGFLGTENSSVFESLFEKKGISDHFIRIPGSTRFGLKISDPVRSETTDINLSGLPVNEPDLEALQPKLDALDAPRFVLAGSLPPGVPDSFYADAIRTLKRRHKWVALDTSGEPLRLALEAQPHLIKPNLAELEALLGRKLEDLDSILAAGRELVKSGIETVAISMGEKGACFVNRDESVVAVPPSVNVVSTVGAGDAMVAGLISGILGGHSLFNSARIATAFSVDAVSHYGPGLSSPQLVRQLESEISLRSFGPIENF